MSADESRATAARTVLASLAGRWSGTAKVWFEPGSPAIEDAVTGEVVLLHGGAVARHDYATAVDGAACTGTALMCATAEPAGWQVAWVDTFHTGSTIMLSTGEDGEPGQVNVLGSYLAEGQTYGWRTTYQPSDSGLLVRHYNIDKDGEALAVEFDYRPA